MYIYALIGARSQAQYRDVLLTLNVTNLNYTCMLILKSDKIETYYCEKYIAP